jgi:hypothetical protein
VLVALADDVVEIDRLVTDERAQPEVVELCAAPHNSTHVEHLVMWSAPVLARRWGDDLGLTYFT